MNAFLILETGEAPKYCRFIKGTMCNMHLILLVKVTKIIYRIWRSNSVMSKTSIYCVTEISAEVSMLTS